MCLSHVHSSCCQRLGTGIAKIWARWQFLCSYSSFASWRSLHVLMIRSEVHLFQTSAISNIQTLTPIKSLLKTKSFHSFSILLTLSFITSPTNRNNLFIVIEANSYKHSDIVVVPANDFKRYLMYFTVYNAIEPWHLDISVMQIIT